jgi:Na+/proline symporter
MPHISFIDITVIAIYLLAVLGVGIYQARKIRTTGDYYAGGRKFNKFYLMMHALGTASHADEPVSVIGGAYEKGLSGIWYTYLYLPLTPIFWLLAPYIRRTRFVTVADFFRARYDPSLSLLYSILGVLKMAVAMSVVLKGTAVIFASLTGGAISEKWAILAMTIVFVTYGFAGGLRATVVTETLQGPLIVIMSLLLVPFGLWRVGGFDGLHHALAGHMFTLTVTSALKPGQSGHEFTLSWIIAMSLTALIGWVAQPGIVADMATGKTELEGRVGYTYGTMIKRVCAIGWVFTGILVAALVAQGQLNATRVAQLGQKRELAFGVAMESLLPVGLMGLMFASIFASQMATLSANMVNSSALASRNLYHEWIRPTAGDREVLFFGRVIGLFLVVLGVLLAFTLQRVATALTMLLGFASIMGVVVWAGVLWRRANSAGAWSAAIVLFLTWVVVGPVGMIARDWGLHAMPAWVGMYGREGYIAQLMMCYLPVGVVTMVVVSLLTKPPPPKQIRDFFMLLNTPVGHEQKLIDAGVPIVYVGSTTPNYWEINHPRLVHWGGCLLAAIICAMILGLLYLLANIGA